LKKFQQLPSSNRQHLLLPKHPLRYLKQLWLKRLLLFQQMRQ
jgi:hypothetical protein